LISYISTIEMTIFTYNDLIYFRGLTEIEKFVDICIGGLDTYK